MPAQTPQDALPLRENELMTDDEPMDGLDINQLYDALEIVD
jgi:hypothetical protein